MSGGPGILGGGRVERRNLESLGEKMQLSSVFQAGGLNYALISDTETNRTIVSELPPAPGEEFGALLRGGDAEPGSPLALEAGGRVEGYGVFEFPYGPVSWGVPEAGAFGLMTYGERVLKVVPRVNFKKRGVERAVLGRAPEDALLFVERSAGNFSAAYSTCFATAVEDSLGLEVPSEARWTRAVALELERIYNHLYAFGRLAEAASQNVAATQTHALRERVLRLNSRHFGHRYLFGINSIGGVRRALPKDERSALTTEVRLVAREFSEIVQYFLSSRIFLDRLQGTAKLTKKDALGLGAVGPSARGSGVQWDDRLTFPLEPYDDIYVNLETDDGEDTMARTMVRVREVESSTIALRELLDRMPSDGTKSGTDRRRADVLGSGFSFCRVESPSGDLIQVVQLDGGGRVRNLHVRPPSLVNWLPFARSLEGTVFTDFQFAFESFGLSFADSDR